MEKKRSAWEDVCGIWESTKGKCRIYWDELKGQCTYEEILWGGPCRLVGFLFGRSEEHVWEFSVYVQDGIKDNDPKRVGSLRLELLRTSHPSLHIQVWVTNEDSEWQPPVLAKLLRRHEKKSQKERRMHKKTTRNSCAQPCRSLQPKTMNTIDDSIARFQMTEAIPIQSCCGRERISSDPSTGENGNEPSNNLQMPSLEKVLWLVPGVARRCGAGMEVGSVSCRGSALTVDDDRIEARCSLGCGASFHARCYQKLMRKRGGKCLYHLCQGEIMLAHRAKGADAKLPYFEPFSLTRCSDITSSLPGEAETCIQPTFDDSSPTLEAYDTSVECTDQIEFVRDITSEAKCKDEDINLIGPPAPQVGSETRSASYSQVDSFKDNPALCIVEIAASRHPASPESQTRENKKAPSSQKLRCRNSRLDLLSFHNAVTGVQPERNNELDLAPEVFHSCHSKQALIDKKDIIKALQGTWVNVYDKSEKYRVIGLDVSRFKDGVIKTFQCHWNVQYGCIEWGRGKYFLQHPEELPMRIATWSPINDGIRSFSWKRESRPLASCISPNIEIFECRPQPNIQPRAQAQSMPSSDFANVHKGSFSKPTYLAGQDIFLQPLEIERHNLSDSAYDPPKVLCTNMSGSRTEKNIWPVYKHPVTGQRWRCNPEKSEEYFFEDDPMWQRFKHVLDNGVAQYWWWHEQSSRVVFE